MEVNCFFNREDYSDVTIKFGERQFFCHKMVICPQSDFFMKLCGPKSQFAEATQKIIELKGDDPDAVEAVIRHMYKTPYDSTQKQWRFQLSLKMVADKYLLPSLSEEADTSFLFAINKETDIQEVVRIIRTLDEEMSHDSSMNARSEMLREKHRAALLEDNDYRAYLNSDKSLLWRQFDELKEALSDGHWRELLVKETISKCLTHGSVAVGRFESTRRFCTRCSNICQQFGTSSCVSDISTAEWFKPGSVT